MKSHRYLEFVWEGRMQFVWLEVNKKKITSPSVLNLEILFQMLYGFQGTVFYQRGILKLIYKSNLWKLMFAAAFSANKYT